MIFSDSYSRLFAQVQGLLEIGIYTSQLPDLNIESIYSEAIRIALTAQKSGVRDAEFGIFQVTNLFLPMFSHPFFSDTWIEVIANEVNTRLWREKIGVRIEILQQRINGLPTLVYEVSVVPVILDNPFAENWNEVA